MKENNRKSKSHDCKKKNCNLMSFYFCKQELLEMFYICSVPLKLLSDLVSFCSSTNQLLLPICGSNEYIQLL